MPDSKTADVCPVDHTSRQAWLSQAKSAQAESKTVPRQHPPTSKDEEEACPVDHKAREAWLQQARAASESTAAKPAQPTPSQPQPQPQAASSSWASSLRLWIPFSSSSSTSSPSTTPFRPTPSLGTDRVISTIPRSSTPGEAACPPANQELETGSDSKTGNWIYPSEKMFFEAMKRKGHDPQSTDMQTVVPIHNAVNERAWAEIKKWEGPWVKESSCDGPRLHSFSGLGSTKLSPRARINTMLGYSAPFDRHDWVVDRCGKEVEYIIDFYAGKSTGDGRPSFYLDVRPKLNSWEGIKMRATRGLGVV
ncbi:cytochrome c/c1 heme-lyase [Pseudomassariella vexata]|uniref:Holocytochrome c-type synthase n=1 Tax=Pseudomassariella vexata TaxID=1141098 RepID=A0A1Y2DZG2_9PEZI|nr:cytochrome c/c1 heme-lyase [Pseudomassariella vexata]ORY64496.1 cytochrome c/c1 heme-lyase [Pseudomassariella vexata]